MHQGFNWDKKNNNNLEDGNWHKCTAANTFHTIK